MKALLRYPFLSSARLLLWWVLASAAGFAVGGFVESVVEPSRGLIVVLYMTIGGTSAGLLQWFVLRRQVSDAGLWVAACIGGGLAVGVLGAAVGVLAGVGAGVVGGLRPAVEVGADTAGVAAAVSYGAVVGVVQWLVLQRQFPRSYWWVLASAAGWILGGLAAGVTEGVAGWAVLGAVYGAITGVALAGILARRPVEA